MADDLSPRRETRAKAAADTAAGRRAESRSGGSDREKPPPLWRWFSAQIAHNDPTKRAAAVSVRSRWDLPVVRFSKIDRALATEDSEHLPAFRALLDEYRVAFDIESDDPDLARETGAAGLLVPFTVEKCEDCTRDAVPGTGKCARHGGQWISPEDQKRLSQRIHDSLLVASESAVRVLVDLMDNGRSEQVRLMAATAVLDRVGIGPHMNHHHDGDITISAQDKAAAELRGRLEEIANRQQEARALIDRSIHSDDDEVVDAEVVAEGG